VLVLDAHGGAAVGLPLGGEESAVLVVVTGGAPGGVAAAEDDGADAERVLDRGEVGVGDPALAAPGVGAVGEGVGVAVGARLLAGDVDLSRGRAEAEEDRVGAARDLDALGHVEVDLAGRGEEVDAASAAGEAADADGADAVVVAVGDGPAARASSVSMRVPTPYSTASSMLVAAMSLRNSAVIGLMAAATSRRLVRRREPESVSWPT
jgi:hypothetical protein